jgi:D-methionine transport system substrate-binding protein
MPQLYNNKQGDTEVINSNYAVQAKLSPAKDAIAVEKSSSPYSNIVAIRPDEKNNKALKKVIKALKSKSTQSWIKKHFKGSVEPVE